MDLELSINSVQSQEDELERMTRKIRLLIIVLFSFFLMIVPNILFIIRIFNNWVIHFLFASVKFFYVILWQYFYFWLNVVWNFLDTGLCINSEIVSNDLLFASLYLWLAFKALSINCLHFPWMVLQILYLVCSPIIVNDPTFVCCIIITNSCICISILDTLFVHFIIANLLSFIFKLMFCMPLN